MSKAALKKELALMSKEQLEILVLEAYAARKDIREYFDYFLNPDPESKYIKALSAVEKECARGKYGRCRARITAIRKAISDLASFQPGPEYEQRLRLAAISHLLDASRRTRMSDTLARGFARLITEYLEIADRQARFTPAVDSLQNLCDSTRGTPSFRSIIARQIKDFLH